ncbi:MAG: helix-turn-helix transcriptional regulator [Bacteroidota bacterium]
MKDNRFNRITAILAEEKIDNGTLAQYLGVSPETVSKWRNNKSQPPVKKLYKIAEFFKMDVRELLVPRTWESGPSLAELSREKAENKKG